MNNSIDKTQGEGSWPRTVRLGLLLLVGLASSLPFSETQWYFSVRNFPGNARSFLFYVAIGLFAVFSMAFMMICLAITQDKFKKHGGRFADSLLKTSASLKSMISRSHFLWAGILLGIIVLSSMWVQGWDWDKFKLIVEHHFLEYVLAAILAFVFPIIARLVWYLVRSFVASIPKKPLQRVVDDWSLTIMLLPVYVVIFLVFTTVLTNGFKAPERLKEAMTYYWTGYWKDIACLSIIAGLYVGTFKLCIHRATTFVFSRIQDFIFFVIACSVIAVLAVSREYAFYRSDLFVKAHPESWQRIIGEIHTPLREIGFLLVPIAIYLFWMFRCVIRDLPREEEQQSDKG